MTILRFKTFCEAWENRIQGEKRDPTHFMKNAKKLGKVGDLEIHSAETAGGGMTHFTWSPKDKMIHHVLHSVEAHKDGDNVRLKFLSAHGRKTSPVRMHQVYKELITKHNRTMVGTSQSPGARKMWDRLRQDPELKLHGINPDGSKRELKPDERTHAPYGATDPEEKKIGRMHLELSKR
jgi:hypothetical protein